MNDETLKEQEENWDKVTQQVRDRIYEADDVEKALRVEEQQRQLDKLKTLFEKKCNTKIVDLQVGEIVAVKDTVYTVQSFSATKLKLKVLPFEARVNILRHFEKQISK